jgi:Zn-dependent protease with chaperone function
MPEGSSTIHDRLVCPDCGQDLPAPAGNLGETIELRCGGCGGTFRARRRSRRSDETAEASPAVVAPVGGLDLMWRSTALGMVRALYYGGTTGFATLLIAGGGFIPVLRRWLEDDLSQWGEVIETLGGVRVSVSSSDPDGDLGPAISRVDAPRLFEEVLNVSRALGARPPEQIRITYLPCCAVVAWKRSRALLLGLPLLHILSVDELRAVLAHELAHLAKGDATVSARSAQFVEGLRQALDRKKDRSLSPLWFWARGCRHIAEYLIAPIARGQEARADRASGAIAGGTAAASALVKVAAVQPIFREVLDHYSPENAHANLYAFFREFWGRIPESLHVSIRHGLLSHSPALPDDVHPPLPDRLWVVQAYADRSPILGDHEPAAAMLADLEALEQMLHNRLFRVGRIEASVFHRAGT